jgi:IMP cyclohydrolase
MEQQYLGRIVAVGITPGGKAAVLYRVSSRSFPNRFAKIAADGRGVAILPKAGHESDILKNPYIAYNCARLVGNTAILANGSHTDPIAEKIAMGMPIRDAIALSLLAMDFEKDDYDTPRIVAAAAADENTGWLGTIRRGGLDVQSFALDPGRIAHVSTYCHDIPAEDRVSDFTAETADEACAFILGGGVFAGFSHAVTGVAVVARDSMFTLAIGEISQSL